MGRPRKTARKGRMSLKEKQLLEAVDSKADIAEAAKALAPVLKRSPEALRKAIKDVRAGLVEKAQRTADILHESMEAALAQNQPQVSGRLALDVLERLSVGDERIFEPQKTSPTGQTGVLVNIQLPTALGGTKPSPGKQLPTVEVLEIEAAG